MDKRIKTAFAAGLVLLAIAAAFLVVHPTAQAPSALPPSFTVDGTKYIISSYLAMEDQLPQGFALGGSCIIDDKNCQYYVNGQIPYYLYVYQEIYNNVTQTTSMKYMRYVDSRIRGADYISCGGSLYVSLWSADQSLTQEEQNRVLSLYDRRMEGMPPAEFEYVGKAEFTGYDTIPDVELGCNTGSPEVYIHSTDDTILLGSISWNTAPHGDEDGRHTGFNVYVKCENPME